MCSQKKVPHQLGTVDDAVEVDDQLPANALVRIVVLDQIFHHAFDQRVKIAKTEVIGELPVLEPVLQVLVEVMIRNGQRLDDLSVDAFRLSIGVGNDRFGDGFRRQLQIVDGRIRTGESRGRDSSSRRPVASWTDRRIRTDTSRLRVYCAELSADCVSDNSAKPISSKTITGSR